jgi:hypothetical protein
VRVEDIVGVSFFAVLIPALVVTIAGSRNSLTSRQRVLWRGWGLGLIGSALFAVGLANFLLIHNSPRPVVEGNLWDAREIFSRQSRGSRFMITDAAGHAVPIWCNYAGPGLAEGERARVRYVAYNGKLLDMDMLTGPYQVWHLHESSGEAGWWLWVAMGAVIGFFAYRQFSKLGGETDGCTATPKEE